MQTLYPGFQIYFTSADPMPYTLSTPVVIPTTYLMYASVVEVALLNNPPNVTGSFLEFSVGTRVTPRFPGPDQRVTRVSIPDGNYTNEQIAEFFTKTYDDFTLQMDYSAETNTFVCLMTPRDRWKQIHMVATDFGNRLGFWNTKRNGFYQDEVVSGSRLIPAHYKLVSKPIYSAQRNVYVNTSLSVRVGTGKNEGVLCKVPVTGDIWWNKTGFGAQVFDKSIGTIEVWLTDDFGATLTTPWSLTLQFDVVAPPDVPAQMPQPTLEITGTGELPTDLLPADNNSWV